MEEYVKDCGLFVLTKKGPHISGESTSHSVSNSIPIELIKALETLQHKAKGDYNKWSANRNKKTTFSYEEAMTTIRNYRL